MSASMLKYLIAADSLCDGENGVSLTALALKAGVTMVSAYRAVDRLETDGYLSRESKKKIVLTKKGVDSLRTYMREVYVLRDALMQICKQIAEHVASQGCGRAKRQEYRSSHGFFREKRCKKSGLVFGTEPKRAFRARFYFA